MSALSRVLVELLHRILVREAVVAPVEAQHAELGVAGQQEAAAAGDRPRAVALFKGEARNREVSRSPQ